MDPDQGQHSVGLIWVQTVCKGYEYIQRTKIARKELTIKNGDTRNEKICCWY